MANIEIGLSLDIADSIKQISAFEKQASDSLKQIEKTSNSLKFLEGFEVAIQVAEVALKGFEIALHAVAEVFKEATAAAIAKDDAINKLNVSLKLSGDFSEKTSKSFQKLAESLQASTGADSNAILNVISLAKAYGLTNEQTEKLTKTSLDLSAVTGQDLNTSADQLIKTFGGVTKGLDKTNPELKNLSVAALTSGAAIDVLGSKFKGAAEGLTNTFGGAVRLAKGSFEELLVSIGQLVTQNPLIIAGTKELGALFEQIRDVFERNKQTIIDLVNNGFIAMLKAIPVLIEGFGKLDQFITTVSNSYTKLRGVVDGFIATITGGSKEEIASIAKNTEDAINSANVGLEKRQQIIDELSNITQDYIDTVEEQAKKQITNTGKEITLLNSKIKATQQLTDATQKLRDEEAKNTRNFFKGEIGKASKGGIAGSFEPSIAPDNVRLSSDQKDSLEQQKRVAGALGDASLALQGAAGAQKLVTQTVTSIAETLLPGFGAVIGETINVLSQGPEKVKEMVNAFINQIPIILQNIALSVPVLIESLVLGIDALLQTIADRLPAIIDQFLAGMVALLENEQFIATVIGAANKFALSLSAQAPAIAVSFQIAMVKESPKIALAIAQGTVEAIKQQFQAAGNIFGGGGGGGGIGGAVGSVRNFLGFADGGDVPGGAPFTDRIPAMLTPGESVLSRDRGARLDSLIDKMERGGGLGAGGNMVIQPSPVYFGEEQVAQIMFKIKRAEYRT